ncbi:MAG: hypothetical protein J5998_14285 [Clostridia bacterium]|nr:hypothetical protein [Clostridia bacterium]
MKTEQKQSKKAGERRIQEKKRQKRSRLYTKIFYGFYALTVIALFVGFLYASRVVSDYVKAYEASQPKYAASAAAQPFYAHDYDVLSRHTDQDIFQYESRAEYEAYMEKQLAGKFISYNEVFTTDEDLKKYVVKADDQKIGDFTLRHSADHEKYGFWLWTLDSMNVEGPEASVYTVDAPSGATVLVDGKPLGEDDIVVRDIPEFDLNVTLPEDAVLPSRCVYEFRRYFGVSDISVTDVHGEPCEVSVSGRRYTAAYNYDDSRLAEALEERVIRVVRRLSCYMTNDYSQYSMDKDLVKDSQAYKYVHGFDSDWIASHRSYDFLNMDVRNYVSYSEDCFSAEARYDYKITYYYSDPEIYPTAYRLFFRKTGDEWKLFDFTLI